MINVEYEVRCALIGIKNVLCLTTHYTGYVPLPTTKIDFSSDLEKADPNQKKKKKRVTKIVAFIIHMVA